VEEEWVGPVELLAALEGNEGSKRDAVERRIRGKQMALRADAVLINGEPSGHIVPNQLWTNNGGLEADWLRGDFVRHPSGDTWIRYEAFGVRFSKADAERMGAEFGREDADDTRAIVAEVASKPTTNPAPPIAHNRTEEAVLGTFPPYKRQAKEPPQRRMLRKFLVSAQDAGWLDSGGTRYRTMERMLSDYQVRCGKEKPTKVTPYEHSAFNKWVRRFNLGEWQ
jgi:hypothetical protein